MVSEKAILCRTASGLDRLTTEFSLSWVVNEFKEVHWIERSFRSR